MDPLHPLVTQDGGHPISSFILPPFSIFFLPNLSYSTITIPRSTSLLPLRWPPLLGQQAPPLHLLPYFFTFNRPRRRPLQLIQSICVVTNNQHQALPPPPTAIDQTSRAALIQGISKRRPTLRPSRQTLIPMSTETTRQTCQIWSGSLERRTPTRQSTTSTKKTTLTNPRMKIRTIVMVVSSS